MCYNFFEACHDCGDPTGRLIVIRLCHLKKHQPGYEDKNWAITKDDTPTTTRYCGIRFRLELVAPWICHGCRGKEVKLPLKKFATVKEISTAFSDSELVWLTRRITCIRLEGLVFGLSVNVLDSLGQNGRRLDRDLFRPRQLHVHFDGDLDDTDGDDGAFGFCLEDLMPQLDLGGFQASD